MVIFDSAFIYVDSAPDLVTRLQRIDNIIDALETQALAAATNMDITSYSLDDGQTKINTVYRSAEDVEKAITAFETIRQRILRRLNKSGVVRLVDGRNFIGPRNFR